MVEVSVVIPSYNSAQYLPAAIDSVLAQSFRDLEVLVIDDGSTDDTAAVMRGYGAPVRYIRQSNGGVAVARNKGIEESRGRYIAFLDADDTWMESKLESQLAALAQHTECGLCYSGFTLVGPDLSPIRRASSNRRSSAFEDLLQRGNVIGSICSVVCERSLFEVAGGFDPALSQCADWDLWVRLAAHTEFLYLDTALVTYRQHETNMSRNAQLLERDSLIVLTKGFGMPCMTEHLSSSRNAAFGRNYMVLAGTYFHSGLYRDFVRCAALAIALDIRQIGYLAGFPARVMKRCRPGRAA